MTKMHEIKIKPKYYVDVITGMKTFELRENDRDYQVGDVVKLMEWDKGRSRKDAGQSGSRG